MEAYSFWCSKCKKDHGGECVSDRVKETLRLLGQALETGSYTAAPNILVMGCELKIDWGLDISRLKEVKFESHHIKLRKQSEETKQKIKESIHSNSTFYHEFDGI
jgi:hypothetical protein